MVCYVIASVIVNDTVPYHQLLLITTCTVGTCLRTLFALGHPIRLMSNLNARSKYKNKLEIRKKKKREKMKRMRRGDILGDQILCGCQHWHLLRS